MKLRRREIRVRCVSTDITARKKAEDALRQRESDLAEAQRVAHLGSWSFDITTGAVRWSEELYRIFDIRRTAFEGKYKSFLSRVHPDDRTRVLAVNAKARSSGEPFEVEYRIRMRSGQLKHIREVGYTRKDRGGAVSALFGTAQDITERKQVEEALRESEDRFRALFEQAPVAYNEIDQDGVIRRVNHASCALLGYSLDELIGKLLWDFITPKQREAVRQTLVENLNGSRPIVPFETEILCKDGSPVHVEIQETLIHGKEGEITGLRVALLDNRQRKLAQQASLEARQYNFELKIKNDELAAAVDSARQANLVKSRFLANMSHELRTPLNGIIGLSEVLHDELLGELSPGQKEYVGDILASGRHLFNVVNNLLDLERVELGKMEFYPQVVDLPALLNEVCDVLRTLGDEKRITVSVTVDSALDAIATDPVRLRQIVYHYLSNAIKFSPSGGVVRMRVAAEGAGYFRLDIADDGPGIPAERLSSIFDFYELSRTQRRENEGAGLGLVLTKRIVEAQGGTVGVQSVPGAGSTFYAILPTG